MSRRRGAGSNLRGTGADDLHRADDGFDILAEIKRAKESSLPCDDAFARRYPQVWKLLTIRDGLSADGRNGTSMTLVCEGTLYQLIISVKSAGLVKTITLQTLQDFFKGVELALRDSSIAWREMKGWKAKIEKPKKEEKS